MGWEKQSSCITYLWSGNRRSAITVVSHKAYKYLLKGSQSRLRHGEGTLLTASFSLHSYISHEEAPLKCPLKNPLLYLSRLIPPGVPGGDRLGGLSYGAGEQRANPSAALRLKEIYLLSLTPHTNVLCWSEDVKGSLGTCVIALSPSMCSNCGMWKNSFGICVWDNGE